jgi:acyl-CoA hydrolase
VRHRTQLKAVQRLTIDQLEFARYINPGDGVIWGQAAAEPVTLTAALMQQRHAIGAFDAFVGATWSQATAADHADVVRFSSYCSTANNQFLAKRGMLDVLRCNYSELAQAIRSHQIKSDVLLLQLARDPRSGRLSLSLGYEYLVPALVTARTVIAEVNERAPWTHGDVFVSEERIDILLETAQDPVPPPELGINEITRSVARHVASLIEDGDVLQFGIGSLPEAVLQQLADRRDLGVHSGAFLDSAAVLCEKGVITNARKRRDPGVSIAGVVMGGLQSCRFVHCNPTIRFCSVEYTHDHQVLASIDRFVAINAAVEVDVMGRVNAEVAAGKHVGAVGGAPDFLRGAMAARGGKAIVALPSTAGRGDSMSSRIVSRLTGPVSTPGEDVGFVVTEYGIADLRGKSAQERANRLADIAAPPFRDELRRNASQR